MLYDKFLHYLVAEEFVATTERGILVISEFAGVSDYLSESITVNPNSTMDILSTSSMISPLISGFTSPR